MQQSNNDHYSINDPEFLRKREQALRTREDFLTISEYAEHIRNFSSDLALAFVTSTDPAKAFDISKDIEKVLEDQGISNVVFALAVNVEALSKIFENYSNPAIIFAGFMKIVNDIHKQRLASEATHSNKENDNA